MEKNNTSSLQISGNLSTITVFYTDILTRIVDWPSFSMKGNISNQKKMPINISSKNFFAKHNHDESKLFSDVIKT